VLLPRHLSHSLLLLVLLLLVLALVLLLVMVLALVLLVLLVLALVQSSPCHVPLPCTICSWYLALFLSLNSLVYVLIREYGPLAESCCARCCRPCNFSMPQH
jgi:hypothetical protein